MSFGAPVIKSRTSNFLFILQVLTVMKTSTNVTRTLAKMVEPVRIFRGITLVIARRQTKKGFITVAGTVQKFSMAVLVSSAKTMESVSHT